jgi:CDP-diacylglycerol--serine O-phosphatidyltransferase
MSIKKHIPNAITCGNLLCGCLALVKIFEGDMVFGAYLVGIAVILDFFDGFTARMLGVASPIGKDLDSLADMVTFGVVPGAMLFTLIRFFGSESLNDSVPYLGFCVSIFSGIRLAKFNNDTRQSDSFIGVPTPTNAILVSSLVLILAFHIDYKDILLYFGQTAEPNVSYNTPFTSQNFHPGFAMYKSLVPMLSTPWTYLVYSFLFSYLLIAEIPLFALKFKHFKWEGNQIRFIFLGVTILMLIVFQFVGIPIIIGFYILLSIVNNFLSKRRQNQSA